MRTKQGSNHDVALCDCGECENRREADRSHELEQFAARGVAAQAAIAGLGASSIADCYPSPEMLAASMAERPPSNMEERHSRAAAAELTCGVCLDGRAVEFFSVRKGEDDRFFIHNRPACRKCMRVVLMLLGPIDELEIFEGRMA